MNSKLKILIIEDDEFVRFGLKELLEENNYEVFEAINGPEGVKAAVKVLPSLIICDIMMPELDGLGVLKALGQNIKTAVIPFIFLTALSDIKDLRKGMDLGANDYIIKPYDTKMLLNSVNTRLKKVEAFKASLNNNSPDIRLTNEKKLNDQHLLFLENNSDAGFFKIDDIVYIEAQNVYSAVYNKEGKNIIIRKTLKQWEEHLPVYFARISRSIIVNINFIIRTEKKSSSSYLVYLQNVQKPINLSPKYKALIKKMKVYNS